MAMSAKTVSIPAPVGGLNARDSLAEMPPTDAYRMDNWDANTTNISLRLGAQNWVTGLPGFVESIFAYNEPNNVEKLFAACSGNIYDVTSSGVVGAAVVTGNSSSRWVDAQITTPGGTFTIAVNGADYAQVYNGTSWQQVTGVSTPLAITGVPTNQLSYVCLWKQRLYFAQTATLGFWYLATNSIGGAASYFDISAQFQLGGYLVAIAPWSAGSADNPQEYIAFISSQGEIVIYQGFDPTQAGLFSLAMSFRVGTPCGNRPVAKYGDDVVIISTDGLFSLREAMSTNMADPTRAISYKVEQAINTDATTYNSNFGWNVCYWPQGSKLIVNVPTVSDSQSYQYIYNTISKAWSRYTGWNAGCFCVWKNQVFYGGNGIVAQAFQGNNDFGGAITSDVRPAFSAFGDEGKNKQWTMVRPIFSSDDVFSTAFTLNTNFSDNAPAYALSYAGSGTKSYWNTSVWNVALWQQGLQTYTQYKAVSGIGMYASLRIQATSATSNLSLYSITYVFKDAGMF